MNDGKGTVLSFDKYELKIVFIAISLRLFISFSKDIFMTWLSDFNFRTDFFELKS